MQVRIYKPTKSSMQSGNSKDKWEMQFVKKNNAKFKEDLMARTSSSDMYNEINLNFDHLEEAINFAQKRGYHYEVIQPKEVTLKKKSYASNFK